LVLLLLLLAVCVCVCVATTYYMHMMDFIYRPRKSYQSSQEELFVGVFVLITFFTCCVIISTYPQSCIPPGEDNQNGTLAEHVEFNSPHVQHGVTCWWYGLTCVILFGIYITGYMIMRVFPLQAFIGAQLILIASIPSVIIHPLDNEFEYLKLYSVGGAAIIVLLYRLTNVFKHMKFAKTGYWAEENLDSFWSRVAHGVANMVPGGIDLDGDQFKLLMVLFFCGNILEAVVYDFERGHIANGIFGLWLIVSMPRGHFASSELGQRIERRMFWFANVEKSFKHVLFVDNTENVKGHHYDAVYEIDWYWAFAYFTWNACFSFDERKEHFAAIIVVLVAALYGGANPYDPYEFLQIDSHLFVQARLYTLSIRYAILAFFDPYQEFLDTSLYYVPIGATTWGYINIASLLFYLTYKAVVFDPDHDQKGELDLQPPGVITEEHRISPGSTSNIIINSNNASVVAAYVVNSDDDGNTNNMNKKDDV
jgi:hypothetical protein